MSADRDQVQHAFGLIVRHAALCERLRAEPEATLAELGLDARERAGMLGVGNKRLLVYNEMVHARLFKTIRSFLEGAGERIGESRLSAEVREWIAASGPKSRYLRDVAAEFFVWVRPRWDADESLPPWLTEYCDHVLAVRSIRNDPRVIAAPSEINLELERPVLCNATTRVYRYRWAVHRMPTPLPSEHPEPASLDGQFVVGFRHPDDEQPHFFEIKPRSAHLLESLLAGAALRDALFQACAAMGETLNDEILSVTAVTLADLIDRRVLLGGQA
jgi:hypothetical protein